jgi:hypothetical protein
MSLLVSAPVQHRPGEASSPTPANPSSTHESQPFIYTLDHWNEQHIRYEYIKMNSVVTAAIVGAFSSLVALGLSFAAAASYGLLAVGILAFDAIAAAGAYYTFRQGGAWRFLAIIVGVLVIYTLADIGLRTTVGIRVLDLLRH